MSKIYHLFNVFKKCGRKLVQIPSTFSAGYPTPDTSPPTTPRPLSPTQCRRCYDLVFREFVSNVTENVRGLRTPKCPSSETQTAPQWFSCVRPAKHGDATIALPSSIKCRCQLVRLRVDSDTPFCRVAHHGLVNTTVPAIYQISHLLHPCSN